ncbi:hypothetical protein ABEF91_005581 [Exophiala dermatitidis]
MEFLSLPLEIRLQIYCVVFGRGKAVIEANGENDSACVLPKDGTFQHHSQRSSQLLRVNRMILLEARPVLYANTRFHVMTHAFAGKLPARVTDGHPCAPYVKHLIWQLDCDMLKRFYSEDCQLEPAEAAQWLSFELRCRADTWRDSFLGEWCDRQAFVKGRDQVISCARMFRNAMSSDTHGKATLVEDRTQLGRGRVILKLERNKPGLPQEDSLEELPLASP